MNQTALQFLVLTLCLALLPGAQPTIAQDRDLLLTGPGRGEELIPLGPSPNYRNRMRDIVEELSDYARGRDPSFALIVRPGFELLRWDQHEFIFAEAKRPPGRVIADDAMVPLGLPMRRFIQAIDGIVLTNQFCGDGLPLPNLQRFQAMRRSFQREREGGVEAIV